MAARSSLNARRVFHVPAKAGSAPGVRILERRRPRGYAEWRALRAWNRLPSWEGNVPGYELRAAREDAGLTQAELAARLATTQQAVARAERAASNPTVRFMEKWAAALGRNAKLRIE